ncbi:hypothetical protein ET445_05510 [Agromyces protaetiae]|uniref:Uncharacterized protein n=1 Tax=Agromyces protaetiae TaxID=2509455 RepID=A0A4P6FQS2_9MICO|nr:hypothetical protein [Agromyces protaetiae]QAY72878.1 hypothetical protein ET445_05510 [Agromyces protaetiae]
MSGGIRPRKSRTLLAAAATIAVSIGLSGCSPATDPASDSAPTFDPKPAELSVETAISRFFSFLYDAGSPETALERTDLNVDLASDLALFLTDDGYFNVEDRTKLLDVEDISVTSDGARATATVTYEVAGTEVTAPIELVRTDEPMANTQLVDYAVVIPTDAFGIDATGAELLPPDTVYTIGEYDDDVSAVFRAAVGWAAPDGTLPRIPAFGGTYPLTITVPGDGGFTDTLVLKTSTFYGGDGTDGVLEAFAHAHGF